MGPVYNTIFSNHRFTYKNLVTTSLSSTTKHSQIKFMQIEVNESHNFT